MRYAQGGGLTAERRRFRERIRYEAGERFAWGERTAVIERDLWVSERSVERWRHAWQMGGMDALASTGPAKVPKVSDCQFAELEQELALGPAERGWEDQRWTLARVRALIAWKFGIGCSSATVCGCCTGMAGPGSLGRSPLVSRRLRLAGAAGLEPAASGFGDRRSGHLS
ncbi:hypothetical protein [Streptomyces sp. NPDC001604]|uniref:hypothetical protein n=1 Tax=Streptomyces sp. NPDC001604 TaxID=3364593 RepID=UPI0036859AE5